MTNTLDQARALQAALLANPVTLAPGALVETVVSCCADLNRLGRFDIAAELASAASATGIATEPEARLRLELARARALTRAGRWAESLAIVRELESSVPDVLRVLEDEDGHLRNQSTQVAASSRGCGQADSRQIKAPAEAGYVDIVLVYVSTCGSRNDRWIARARTATYYGGDCLGATLREHRTRGVCAGPACLDRTGALPLGKQHRSWAF
jgi:hypothetical protein